MAVIMKSININDNRILNLSRSIEKILEEANASGELKLCGRKMKDFPKIAGNYDLSDTVFADLSRNRFSELPACIFELAFLERLFVYHNAIRYIPETVRGLHSLTYLDLRNNQLSVLPREICFLPLQVFLVSNNRLVGLPEELGRMTELTELDAACNQITHLPARLSELTNLRSLVLRQNQLVYLPRELTCLQLVSLDISSNKIAQLPIELRLMTSLVDLELSDNPLTSPPASLCARGLVHIFKYLSDILKDGDHKNGGTDSGNTLRRQMQTKHSNSFNENLKQKRQNVDSGYCTSDGFDSRRYHETLPKYTSNHSPLQIRTEIKMTKSGPCTPTLSSPGTNGNASIYDQILHQNQDQLEKKNKINTNYFNNNNSSDVSPEDNTPDSTKSEEKSKSLDQIQTYREYKEQLRQQRSQESHSIYRTKELSTPDGTTPDSPISSMKSQNSSPSLHSSSNQNSPISPFHHGSNQHQERYQEIPLKSEETVVKRPVQKVTPSRNTATYQVNGNQLDDNNGYTKPNSPIKSSQTEGILQQNSGLKSHKPLTSTVGHVNNAKGQKPNKTVSWNRDVPTEKLSFTMRREFDKAKEEEELIGQLRKILESKLKMTLPEEIAPVLCDGVVLCHLANHIRPRSVGSIHVPSPAVPNLTMARKRRNVDNFLEACRKIGVDEKLICSCSDIVPSEEGDSDGIIECRPPNIMALYQTISALIQQYEVLVVQQESEQGKNETVATSNTKIETVEEVKAQLGNNKSARQAPNSLDLASLTRKRKYPSTKFHMMQATSNHNKNEIILNEIIEECEYDSDIGKFVCYDSEENTRVDLEDLNKMNDLNLPQKSVNKSVMETQNIVEEPPAANVQQNDSPDEIDSKLVMKRIEYFESVNGSQEKFDNTKEILKTDKVEHEKKKKVGDNNLPTIIFAIFIMILSLLIVFKKNQI